MIGADQAAGFEIVARENFSDATYSLIVRHPWMAKAALGDIHNSHTARLLAQERQKWVEQSSGGTTADAKPAYAADVAAAGLPVETLLRPRPRTRFRFSSRWPPAEWLPATSGIVRSKLTADV